MTAASETTETRNARRLSRSFYATAAIALAIILFLAVNIVSTVWLRSMRFDLTENGLYTLSDGTRSTLAKLTEPITLRFFFSRDIAADYSQVRAYADEVRDLLQEYASYAPGKIRVEEINPEPYTPEEDAAGAAGLTGAPTQEGDVVFFGLTGTNTINGRETIPFFAQDREQYLEYDITSAIHRLGNPTRPRLGILSTIPLEAGPGGIMAAIQGQSAPFILYEQLAQSFDLKPVDPNSDRIPPEVKTLLIIHPAGLPPRVLYAVDQFVMRGGKAIVIVDPLSELMGAQQQQGMPAQAPVSSDLAPLFKAWGVAYDPNKVVGDAGRAQRVRVGDPRMPAVDYVAWLRLAAEDVNQDDPATKNLQALNIATAGVLRPVTGATTKFTPLVMTSEQAALLDAIEVRMTQQPQDLLRRFLPTGERYAIAARITGPSKSAFAKAPSSGAVPEAAPGQPAPPPPAPLPPHVASAKGIDVVIIADTDFMDDRFWVNVQNQGGRRVATQFADNSTLILNTAESMMGRSDLLQLRARSRAQRPFTVVQDLRRDAEIHFLAEAQTLQRKVQEAEAALRALQGQAPPGQAAQPGAQGQMLTREQEAQVENFRKVLVDTRVRLREVQANLRRDVVNLGNALAFINIALVPILVAAAAIGLAMIRRRRRSQARKLT
jgi:ABC-type uncharacterized transport system involved in gliding motility auxiliary subunit